METVLIGCAVVVTVAFIVAIVFLVQTLSQVRNTARQAEELLSNLNKELATVSKVTGFVSNMVERFTTPWFKIGSWLAATATSYVVNRTQKPHAAESVQEEQPKEQCCAAKGGRHV